MDAPEDAQPPGSVPLQDASALGRLPGPLPRSLWRYGAAIPADGADISMGEGLTPLVAADEGTWFKLEYVSPTGSFKDRGAVVLVASLRARGARGLIADSSGNAGSAIAAYAARAGLSCRVFVPAGTSEAKQAQIRAFGARLEVVPGDRTATAAAAQAAVAAGEAAYASHVHDPSFVQGTKTFAYEVWEQLGGVPDAVVVPAGNGTLVLGAAIGFAELRAAGLTDREPALVAVQSAACAPLAKAWAAGAAAPLGVDAAPTAAEGIAIPAPARGREILAAVRASGGCVVAVGESDIAQARADLARRGLLVEPTGAVAWAALRRARAGTLPDAAGCVQGRVVVPLCGSGRGARAG